MRTALLATALLATQASAQSGPQMSVEDMWTAYTNYCATVVNEPETFYSNLDLISQDAALSVSPSLNGDAMFTGVVRRNFSFDVHVGHVGDHTFMSCGATLASTDTDASTMAKQVETLIAEKLGPDALVGGSPKSYNLSYYNGTYSTEGGSGHEYFADAAIPGVDTVTFIQVIDGWYSIYFHHVFEGRVGLPAVAPQPIERIPQ
ncbi:MAG: hypothetical protein AAGL23_07615 [Pseudomonadota bacterium]